MDKISARQRILDTADRLFYEQGYRATGINQIIKEANVAKATFYQHFTSKEELCAEYLRLRSVKARARQIACVSEGSNPTDRVCGLFNNIRHQAVEGGFTGCAFLNISAEINDGDSILRQAVKVHKTGLIELIKNELAGFENSEMLAETVYVLYEGAIIAVKNYRELWPADRAEALARDMISRSMP